MRKRNVRYKRHLFKRPYWSYADWNKHNPASDSKEAARYESDMLICLNPDCPREHMPISEHEAYYYFAVSDRRQWTLRETVLHKVGAYRPKRESGSCYVCPFCGESVVEEHKLRMFIDDPRTPVPERWKMLRATR
jgi:hypothetical protein